MKFIWNDTYQIGLKEIDEQHRTYFDIVNELDSYIHLKKLDDKEIILACMRKLENYALNHFATEEEYFENEYCNERCKERYEEEREKD